MALGQRLEFKQSQQLVMTPQLQQAIKLLQYSNLELSAFVEQELEQNPLLERADGEAGGEDGGETAEAAEGASDPVSEGADSAELAQRESLDSANAQPLDTDYTNLYSDGSEGEGDKANGPAAAAEGSGDLDGAQAFEDWGPGGSRSFDDPETTLDQTYSQAPSLRDHLEDQLNLAFDDAADRAIGLYLVDLLDSSGYMDPNYRVVADQLGCSYDDVERVLGVIQRFDPAGIAARSVAECLAVQLAEQDRLDPAMQALLENLGLVERGDLAALAKRCGVDREDLGEMLAELRRLNPKPALTFAHDVAQTVTPDIIMRPGREGGWAVELNNATLPRVLVNTSYYSEVSKAARNKSERDYLSERYTAANWLVKSLHQRAQTILRVAEAIVRYQEAFFTHGVAHLRPLVLRDIAEDVEMHESTISRVTANKYMATPRGTFELKYFFTSGVQSATGGEAVAAEAVKSRIKALIDGEGSGKPLSDDRIAAILRGEGIDIARRTVAKYREAMGYASSSRRKRTKATGL